MRDTWRAESAAFACKQDLQLLVRLAILQSDSLASVEADNVLLKWGYVLDAVKAAKAHASGDELGQAAAQYTIAA